MPDTNCHHRQWDTATAGPPPLLEVDRETHHLNTLMPLPSIHSSFLGFLLAEPIQKLEDEGVSVEKIHRCQPPGSESCVKDRE